MSTSMEESGRWHVLQPLPPKGDVVITPRDLNVFIFLNEHRFADANQLAFILGEKIRRLLLNLVGHGSVTRPPAQRVWRQIEGGGSKPLTYSLGNRGAQALKAS